MLQPFDIGYAVRLCKAVRPDLATLAHSKNTLAILKMFIDYLAKIGDDFGKFYMHLGKYSLL